MGDDLARQPAGPGREPDGHGLPPGSVILEQDFDAGSLYALRAAVFAHGADIGMSRSRLYDAVTAVHELAANAVRHGAGHGHLRMWLADGMLRCEVTDAGPSTTPADGDKQPWREQHGHGLWVIGRVADQFGIDRGPAATIATVAFAVDGKPAQGSPNGADPAGRA